MRRALLVPVLLALSASPALALPRLHVVIRGENHAPRVGKPWSYSVRVTTPAGRPIAAHIHMQMLFGTLPVGEIGRHYLRRGVWRETFGVGINPPFPPASRGQHLTLQATATAKGFGAGKAGWAVVPR